MCVYVRTWLLFFVSVFAPLIVFPVLLTGYQGTSSSLKKKTSPWAGLVSSHHPFIPPSPPPDFLRAKGLHSAHRLYSLYCSSTCCVELYQLTTHASTDSKGSGMMPHDLYSVRCCTRSSWGPQGNYSYNSTMLSRSHSRSLYRTACLLYAYYVTWQYRAPNDMEPVRMSWYVTAVPTTARGSITPVPPRAHVHTADWHNTTTANII